MSLQVTNINIEPTSFKFIDLSGSDRPLPTVNSIVSINILEKAANGYKVLIDGRLFFSSLPVQVNINETLIAKVINNSPFILSLDNIISAKGIDEAISFLLVKLQIPATKETEKVLRSFLLGKKPILKSRLEKITELLENGQTILNADQLSEAMVFLGSDETNHQLITPSLLNLFKYKNSDLAKSISGFIQELNSLIPEDEIVKELNRMFVLNIEDAEQADALKIKDFANNHKEILRFIVKAQDKIPDGKAGDVIKSLTNHMLIYSFRKALSLKNGNNHTFIIVKVMDKYELLEFDLESSNQSYHFNLNMNPENLNSINAKGFFIDNRLSLGFLSEPAVNTFLEQNRNDLEIRLDKNVRCQYNLRFTTNDGAGMSMPARNGKVNVTF